MIKQKLNLLIFFVAGMILTSCVSLHSATVSLSGSKFPANKAITKADCTSEKLGTSIPVSVIGEPVSAVTLDKPVWTEATGSSGGYCSISGEMAPIDKSPTARPIKFAIKLPASWNYRSVHQGGGGMNGSVPDFSRGGPGGGSSMEGFALYGSDSGHSSTDSEWALNEEAIKNLGYMQLKKTHDAAMVLIERMYGEMPKYNYFVGGSQGGREALTVAQRYPEDYEGISASVPIVNFSTLMLAPALMRIQEKSLVNWVPATKSKAVAFEFIRQCDCLDGLTDGIINNYMACREIFNVNDNGKSGKNNPWKDKRCPDNVDPDPDDDSINACFTDEQIETLNFIFSNYKFTTSLANNVTSFGMWAPTTSPAGGMPAGSPAAGSGAAGPPSSPRGSAPSGMPSGVMDMSGSNLLVSKRYKGQEGAAPDAPIHTHLGGLGVNGFIMQDLSANPLDYAEGGKYDARRVQLSQWLDSTNHDLTAFYKHGGKLIVSIGAMDTTASSGAQLDYYKSLIDTMGRKTLDKFARLYVSPQGGHGMGGNKFFLDGDGNETGSTEIPGNFDQFSLLQDWVEKGKTPGKSVIATGRNDSSNNMPICPYPTYPQYVSGDPSMASSYICSEP